MPLTYNQYIALNGAIYFSCSLSTIGSLTIISLILRRRWWKHGASASSNRRVNSTEEQQQQQQQTSVSLWKIFQNLPPYEWIMILLSSGDLVVSFSYLFASIVVPEGTPGAYWAIGNTASCAAFGFLSFFGSQWVAGWNCFLAIYFLLSVRYNWKERDFTLKIKCCAFFLVLLVTAAASINGLIQTSYNFSSNSYTCIMGDHPDGCAKDPDVECERGENASSVAFVSFVAVVLMFSLIGFACTFVVYCTVRTYIKRSLRHSKRLRGSLNSAPVKASSVVSGVLSGALKNTESHSTHQEETTELTEQLDQNLPTITPSGSTRDLPKSTRQSETATRLTSVVDSMSQSQQERLRQTAWQAVLYSLAYLNVFLWPFVPKVIYEIHEGQPGDHQQEPLWFTLLFLAWLFYPLQGFLNFIIFIRLDIHRWRKLNPDASRLWVFQQCVLQGREPTRCSASVLQNVENITGSHHHQQQHTQEQDQKQQEEQQEQQQQHDLEAPVSSRSFQIDSGINDTSMAFLEPQRRAVVSSPFVGG